ncbi:hypothetical protein, partial [Serratia quinivorans]
AVKWLVSVLANTKLTTFTAVFYWFTLIRDEPKIRPGILTHHLIKIKLYLIYPACFSPLVVTWLSLAVIRGESRFRALRLSFPQDSVCQNTPQSARHAGRFWRL